MNELNKTLIKRLKHLIKHLKNDSKDIADVEAWDADHYVGSHAENVTPEMFGRYLDQIIVPFMKTGQES